MDGSCDEDFTVIDPESMDEIDGRPLPSQVPSEFCLYRTSEADVNPASYHALVNAYDELKRRYNDLRESGHTKTTRVTRCITDRDCHGHDSHGHGTESNSQAGGAYRDLLQNGDLTVTSDWKLKKQIFELQLENQQLGSKVEQMRKQCRQKDDELHRQRRQFEYLREYYREVRSSSSPAMSDPNIDCEVAKSEVWRLEKERSQLIKNLSDSHKLIYELKQKISSLKSLPEADRMEKLYSEWNDDQLDDDCVPGLEEMINRVEFLRQEINHLGELVILQRDEIERLRRGSVDGEKRCVASSVAIDRSDDDHVIQGTRPRRRLIAGDRESAFDMFLPHKSPLDRKRVASSIDSTVREKPTTSGLRSRSLESAREEYARAMEANTDRGLDEAEYTENVNGDDLFCEGLYPDLPLGLGVARNTNGIDAKAIYVPSKQREVNNTLLADTMDLLAIDPSNNAGYASASGDDATESHPRPPPVENRYRADIANTGLRQLYIERNFDDRDNLRRQDNITQNVNLNHGHHKEKLPATTTNSEPITVLNNDPLIGHKTIAQRNIFHEQDQQTPVVQPVEQEEREVKTCPICGQEFDTSYLSEDFQQHVIDCLEQNEEQTPRQDSGQGVCPMCNVSFPATNTVEENQRHVNDHFMLDELQYERIGS